MELNGKGMLLNVFNEMIKKKWFYNDEIPRLHPNYYWNLMKNQL